MHSVVMWLSLHLLHNVRVSRDALKEEKQQIHLELEMCQAATCRVSIFHLFFHLMKDSPSAALFTLAAALPQCCTACQCSPTVQPPWSFGSTPFFTWLSTTDISVEQSVLKRGL